MKVHLIHKIYTTGTSSVISARTSRKKAAEELRYILESAEKVDGLLVTRDKDFFGNQQYRVWYSGQEGVRTSNDDVYWIETIEVK